MTSIPPPPHNGIDVPAEATRMVRKFGKYADRYVDDWIQTYDPDDPMVRVLQAVQVEIQRQSTLI